MVVVVVRDREEEKSVSMSEKKGDIRDDNEVTCPMNGCLFQLLETLFFLLFTHTSLSSSRKE